MTRQTRSATTFPDHYATLAVARTASAQQIASRGMALLDQLPTRRVDNAVGLFCSRTGRPAPAHMAQIPGDVNASQIQEAVKVLTDPQARSRYNSQWNRQHHGAAHLAE